MQDYLRHDGELRTVRQQSHLKHVPDYLLPDRNKGLLASQEIGSMLSPKNINLGVYNRKRVKKRKPKVGPRNDPLRSFKVR